MKKFLHTFGSVAGGIAVLISPQIQATIGHNPKVSAVFVAVYAILGHLLPSPLSE